MNYYNELRLPNNLILSCDKLRLNFILKKSHFEDFNSSLNNLFIRYSKCDYEHYTSSSWFAYRDMLVFKKENSVVQLGIGFNGISYFEDKTKCFIEFNPNKTMSNNFVQPLIDLIKLYSIDIELARFDFAVDLPLKRGCVVLSKDKRNYKKRYEFCQTANNIDNITEYLGQRNNNGFVKLYNKTLESKLSYDLTRLEITLDNFSYENFKKELPKVYYYNNVGLMSLQNLSDTDRVFLSIFAQSDDAMTYVNMLSRDKKEKYKKILFNQLELQISECSFYCLVSKIRSIFC